MEQTRCLLMADIVDSTAATSSLGEVAARDFWIGHERASRMLLRRWLGREIDRSDGLLGLFETAEAAAGFASAYHDMLASLRPPVRARVALFLGPVAVHENSAEDRAWGARPLQVAGLGRPLAARLMGLALGGQTLANEAAAAALVDSGTETLEHGHWQFKGFDVPVPVIEIAHALAPRRPPEDGPKAYRVVLRDEIWQPVAELPFRVPAERDTFVGRSAELWRLADALTRPGCRQLSLIGSGGVGKTRLALRFAKLWRGEFPGGTWFCDLSNARGVDGVLHAFGQTLDLPLGRDPAAQIGHALASRGAALLIVDNAEQVADATAGLLHGWIEAAACARFLVTSRVRLPLAGERVVVLDPLAADDAQALFRLRATAVDARLRDDEPDLGTLVHRLEGLPLAIELAAARARTMTPTQMLPRLDDRFRLLAGPSLRGRPDRQSTLHATLDWSWSLLSNPERQALGQLSVFEGGFGLAAAEAVLRVPDGDDWVPDLVQALVDKSLVRAAAADGDAARYDQLRSVQAFAAEHVDAGLRGAAEQRHWSYFGQPASAPDPARELDNLVTACRRATAAGAVDASVMALHRVWAILRRTGPFRPAADLAQALLARAELSAAARVRVAGIATAVLNTLGEPSTALRIADRAIEGSVRHDLDSGDLARLYTGAADAAGMLGDGRRVQDDLTQALALAERDSTDAATRCQVFNALGAAAGDLGHADEAAHWYERGLQVARAVDDPRWQGALLGNLGSLRHVAGDLASAQALYREALALTAAVGDRRWEGNTRCNLGLIHLDEGRLEQAEAELVQVQALARELGHPRLEATAACNLGLLAEQRGQPETAGLHFDAARRAASRAGDRRLRATCCAYLAGHAADRGDLARAATWLAEGDAALDGLDDPLAHCLLRCSELAAALRAGDPQRARQLRVAVTETLQEQGWTATSEAGRRLAWVSRRG